MDRAVRARDPKARRDLGLDRTGRERDRAYVDAELLTGTHQALLIGARGRIDADRYDVEPRLDPAPCQRRDAFAGRGVDALGERPPVQQSHQRAMRDSTKSVIFFRWASAPSSARSRSSDSAFTCP